MEVAENSFLCVFGFGYRFKSGWRLMKNLEEILSSFFVVFMVV